LRKKKKLPPKSTKITDVADPGKTAPSSSGRPILVTNRPVLASDPMMVSEAKPSGQPATAQAGPVVNRTAKVIAPVSADVQALDAAAAAESAPAKPAEPALPVETQLPAEGIVRDAEAEQASAEAEALAAQEARQQELDRLIVSGQYAVPINAVRRKRSRIFVFAMCLLAIVLAVLLFDVLLDANIIKVSTSIPHTHIFSGA